MAGRLTMNMDWHRKIRPARSRPGLMPLDAALAALGDGGSMGREIADVPLAQVVGTVGRAGDFDAEFRPLGRNTRQRVGRVAAAFAGVVDPPPVELIRLGELYFVVDGHHRISVARSSGRAVITATVLHLCTIAYGMGCLRLADLPSKAAEREFLDRVPLPEKIRQNLWLDRPADWRRLADAAEAWGFRHAERFGRPMDRAEFAQSWWQDEVAPVLDRIRDGGSGLDLRDVELYVTALAVRDRTGVGAATERGDRSRVSNARD